jgi:hypothetical protein
MTTSVFQKKTASMNLKAVNDIDGDAKKKE